MWSDTPPPVALARCRRQIAARLSPDTDGSPPRRQRLGGSWDAWHVASAMLRQPGDIWLENADTGSHYIAWSAPLILQAFGPRTMLVSADDPCPRECELDLFGVLEALRLESAERTPDRRLFGYLGYEMGQHVERLGVPPRQYQAADALLGLHATWLEGNADRWDLVSVGSPRGKGELAALARGLQARIEAAAVEPELLPLPRVQEVCITPDDADFERAVADTVSRIVAGEIFQTNLCRRFTAEFPAAGRWALYQRMRRDSSASHGAYVELQDGAVMSMSPESFLSCRGGKVVSSPIKGTRACAGDSASADVAAQKLLSSEKDAAELAMIVDLVRNDLGRVCRAGSVRVLEPRSTMRLPTLVHTYARVAGTLPPGVSWVQLLRAAFPPGSITGAPKIQAMLVAQEIEGAPRGPAMGSIGWIALSGDMELSVAIRTALVEPRQVVYHAGGGIVAGSEPVAERLETVTKASAFLRALAVRGEGVMGLASRSYG